MAGSEDDTLALSLWRAVKTGTIDDVHKAIDLIRTREGLYVSGFVNRSVSDDGKSILYVAVMLNDAEKVRLLIDNHAHLDQDDWSELYEEYGNTHFHVFDILDKAMQDWSDESKRDYEPRLEYFE
jgi:hypothetical protein